MAVIVLAVRWYLRYGLAYRDVEELLAERGISVDHVTVYRWVQRFTPLLIDAALPCRHAPEDRWFVDETYIKVAGRWVYLYRAIDQYGQVIDVRASNDSIENDHGRLKAWLRPMRGLKRRHSSSKPSTRGLDYFNRTAVGYRWTSVQS
jgi:transposase-like protein